MEVIALAKQRRIAVVTTSRADYSHLYWVLKKLQVHPDIDLRLLVSGAHPAASFGSSIEQIKKDGFEIETTIESLIDSDSDVGMAKTIGVATLGFADALNRLRPDILLLIADRYEMLAPASVATALRIPIAHIEGGEISEGAIDDAIRNALTKLSHLHFVSTQLAKRRVIAMGEERWRVTRAGAPSLDHLTKSKLLDHHGVSKALGISLDRAPKVIGFHPVTLSSESENEATALFEALKDIEGPFVFTFPNADTGHHYIIEKAEAFCRHRSDAHLFINLGPIQYWSLLRHAALMIGNSSSGIMESPSLALPCINIGMRQQGRERAVNIIDVPGDVGQIKTAVGLAQSTEFKNQLVGMTNPYGEGHAADTIVDVLANVPINEQLIQKPGLPLIDSKHDGIDAFNPERT